MQNKTKVLFVCMGNICRSPSAQGVFEKLVVKKEVSHKFEIDSAGTTNYHVGGCPDKRSIQFASLRGVDISKQRARQVKSSDFGYYDYIIAMDDDNFDDLIVNCPDAPCHKLFKMMDFAPSKSFTQVPDPYYGGEKGFDLVLDLLESTSIGLLKYITDIEYER